MMGIGRYLIFIVEVDIDVLRQTKCLVANISKLTS